MQDFVKQQQDYESGERIVERELERVRITAQEKERVGKLATQEKDGEIELARIAAEEAKADKDRELERDRIATGEKERMDKFAAQEKDRESS